MKRSKVALLPTKVREQLEQLLIERGFSGYKELEAWCKEQGIDTSKSALQRFGKAFEDRIASLKLATEQARVAVQATPDDDNSMNAALIRLVQERVFSVLRDANGESISVPLLGKITKAVADVGRASVQQSKHALSVRDKLGANLDKLEAAAKKNKSGKAYLDALKDVREKAYGLFDA